MVSLTERVLRQALEWRGFVSHRVPTSVGRVHVLRAAGHGPLPSMTLLHGLSASGPELVRLIHHVRPFIRGLIVPDLLGHGLSDSPPGGLGRDDLRRALFESLDALLDVPTVLFGNSLGGFAAVDYALERPTRVASLVLSSPGGAPMTEAELEDLRRVFRVRSHRDALEFIDRLFGTWSPLRHLLAMSVRGRLSRPDLHRLLASIGPDDLLRAEDLERLEMPVLCVFGRRDRILPSTSREFFRRHLPAHARLVEPESFGHTPYLERPRALAKEIIAFLKAQERSRTPQEAPSSSRAHA